MVLRPSLPSSSRAASGKSSSASTTTTTSSTGAPLWQQRLWHAVYPRLLAAARPQTRTVQASDASGGQGRKTPSPRPSLSPSSSSPSSSSSSSAALVAIAQLVVYSPVRVVMGQREELSTLLVRCLARADAILLQRQEAEEAANPKGGAKRQGEEEESRRGMGQDSNGRGRGGGRPGVGAAGNATCDDGDDDVRLPELLRGAALTALVRMNGLGGVDEEVKRRLRATGAGGGFGGSQGGMPALPATMGELLSRHASRLLEVVPRISGDQRYASPRTRGLSLLLLQQLTSERSPVVVAGHHHGGGDFDHHSRAFFTSASAAGAGGGSSFSALPLVVKVPHRRRVTRALLRVLDDRNRHVRRLAAALRNEWAVLGV